MFSPQRVSEGNCSVSFGVVSQVPLVRLLNNSPRVLSTWLSNGLEQLPCWSARNRHAQSSNEVKISLTVPVLEVPQLTFCNLVIRLHIQHSPTHPKKRKRQLSENSNWVLRINYRAIIIFNFSVFQHIFPAVALFAPEFDFPCYSSLN